MRRGWGCLSVGMFRVTTASFFAEALRRASNAAGKVISENETRNSTHLVKFSEVTVGQRSEVGTCICLRNDSMRGKETVTS